MAASSELAITTTASGFTLSRLSASIENENIFIHVADNGDGIPEDQIEELMQPFVRGNEARTIQGSGLGLSIVKRIVDIHQGELIIQNREQGGLEAIISLPINLVEKTDMPTISRFEKLKQTLTEHF